MKECDNSKIHISSNFVLSTRLLIMFDTLLLRPSLHYNTPLHFTTLHPATLHYTSLHFTILHHTSPNYISLHFATLHHTSPHFTQLHYFTQLHASLLVTGISGSKVLELALKKLAKPDQFVHQMKCSFSVTRG